MSTNPWQAPYLTGWTAPVIGTSTASNSSIIVSWTFPSSAPDGISTDQFLIYLNGNPYDTVGNGDNLNNIFTFF